MLHPTLGRFVSRDPLGSDGVDVIPNTGWFGERLDAMRNRYGDGDPLIDGNLYEYAANNPMRFVDPSGLDVYVVQSGKHTSIEVDVWDGSKHVGVLTADYYAEDYNAQLAFFWCLMSRGKTELSFTPGRKARGTRRVAGTPLQDMLLVTWVMRQTLCSKIDVLKAFTKNFTQAAVIKDRYACGSDWKWYSYMTNSCNDFTLAAIKEYVGDDWTDGESAFTGSGVIELIDSRFDKEGNLKCPPKGSPPTGSNATR